MMARFPLLFASLLTYVGVLGGQIIRQFDADGMTVKVMFVPKKCEEMSEMGDTLFVHYVLHLSSGKQGAASINDGRPWGPMKLGAGDAVRAYDLGLQGMCQGERRILIAPPHLAYGDAGYQKYNILPNETLTFQLTLVTLQKPITIVDRSVPTGCTMRSRAGSKILMHYTGWLERTGKEFDSSIGGRPWGPVILGAGHVIQGMDEALQDMCVGETRRVRIPSHLAYGEDGTNGIPPHSTLMFDIELMEMDRMMEAERAILRVHRIPAICLLHAKEGDRVSIKLNVTAEDYSEGYAYKTIRVTVASATQPDTLSYVLNEMCEGEQRSLTLPPHETLSQLPLGLVDWPAWQTTRWHFTLEKLERQALSTSTEGGKSCNISAKLGDWVSVDFNTSLVSGEQVMSSMDEGRQPPGPLNFTVGQSTMIDGLEQGMLSMCQGETRRMVIPSHLAYGEEGLRGKVPFNATVMFDVKLLSFGVARRQWPDIM